MPAVAYSEFVQAFCGCVINLILFMREYEVFVCSYLIVVILKDLCLREVRLVFVPRTEPSVKIYGIS